MRLSSLWTLIREPLRIKEAVLRRLTPPPIRMEIGLNTPRTYTSYVPDRFDWNYEKYVKMGNRDFFMNMEKFVDGNESNNTGDLTRYYFITLACDQIAKENILGDFAELGVYKGNTAFTLVQTARRLGRTAYLFDTFEGFSKSDLAGVDHGRAVEFEDTTLEAVRSFIGSANATFIKGYFPDSTIHVPNDARFGLVHIDCDLYAPFRAALEYFYPRMTPGGFLIMHDYSSLVWEGVERAVDEFLANKLERIIPIPDKSGTAVLRKV
jgi:hypothetical protein